MSLYDRRSLAVAMLKFPKTRSSHSSCKSSSNRRAPHAAHPGLFRRGDELDVVAAEDFVERRLEVGIAAHFELTGSAQDKAKMLRRIVLVGGVDDQDHVGFSGVAFEDLFGASHLAFAVQAPFEVDRELRREVLVGLLNSEELIDDQVCFAPPHDDRLKL